MKKSIHKNKYEMPHIDSLVQLSSQNFSVNAMRNESFFTTMDLKYAYSQHNLHPETAGHWKFNFLSGDLAGRYRFKTGYYGSTDVPAEFEKAIDKTSIELSNTYDF